MIDKIMLYCPKCQKTYADGSQRFCLNEGERLVPFAAGKSANQTGGVFTNVLKRKTGETPDNFSPAPKLSPAGAKISPQPDFHLLTNSSVFRAEAESEFELELDLPEIESQPLFREPLDSFAESDDVFLETSSDDTLTNSDCNRTEVAEQADFSVETEVENQTDSAVEAVSIPESLIGQTVENRFRIVEQIGDDESDSSFLAEDETASGKKAIVEILTVTDDSFANKVFADERDALLKLTHPNIVSVIDAGELPDGKPFLVTEYVEGETIKSFLEKNGQFSILRAARVVRQTADALGEAHQNGVLHRNLTAGSVVLTVDENGVERVRLKNFGAANEKLNRENLPYKSPEQVEGKTSSSASDNYSLGVIAYRMLTNRLPFDASSVGDLLKSQREGIRLRPSDVRFDLPPAIDEILEKALSFHSSDRFLKARDFGDAFFSEVIANLPPETEEESEETTETATEEIELTPVADELEDGSEAEVYNRVETPTALINEFSPAETAPVKIAPVIDDVLDYMPVVQAKHAPEAVKATEDLAWEKRSPDSSSKSSPRRNLFSLLGVAAVVLALPGIWYYFINRPTEKIAAPTTNESVNQTAPPVENFSLTETNVNQAAIPEEIESPPIPRQVTQPPNSIYFQNSKAAVKGEAVKNYLGFSLYYPTGWSVNNVGNNFLDVSKKAPNGLPIEQMLVSYYKSKGSFKLDAAEIFPAQVAETNQTLKKILPNYKIISEGKKTVNNGWQAYEVKFEGASKTANGETIKIWGKRLFIPTAIRGMKNGYVITMLATSLMKDVESVEDVGVKGELSTILETFEPNQNF